MLPKSGHHTEKDKALLENVQRRFTKSISRLHYLPYTTRLSSLNLPSLFCRRTQIDLTTVYRILHHHTCLEPNLFFSLRTASVTRGYALIHSNPKVRLDSSKYAFHARVIGHWNALPLEVVSAGSVSAFKRRIKCIVFLVHYKYHFIFALSNF